MLYVDENVLGMLISFFPKIDYRFEKMDFFSIFQFVSRSLSNTTISQVVLTF